MGKLLVFSFLVAVCAFVVYIPNVYVDALPNFPTINCTNDTSCSSVTNATCDLTLKNCTCKDPFKISGAQCAWKVLNDTCSDATDCVNVTNSSCGTNSKCTCTGAVKVSGAICAEKVINDSCTQNRDCVHVPHSSCEGSPKKCTCTGAFKVSGTTCVKRVVGDTCTAAADCPLNGNCNTTCVCKTGSIADNGLCLFAVGENCTQKSECVSNADCDNTTKKCKCMSGYDDSKGLCLKHSGSDSSAISVRLTIPLLVMSVLTMVFERIQ